MAQGTVVIVNPRSGGGRTARRWAGLEAQVRKALGPLEVVHTRAPREAERLAWEASRAGARRIVVAGGDGTVGEVVTGLLAEARHADVDLGVLPLGTGSDFARGLGLPRDPARAVEVVATGAVRVVDAGRVEFQTGAGTERACFANVSSFGASGPVLERMQHTSRRFGATLAFGQAAVREILRYRSEPVAVRVDGELVCEAPVVLGAIGNAPWFGGGMQVVPAARIDDGALDVVLVRALPALRLIGLLARGYGGRHVGHSKVSEHRGRVIEADAAPGRVTIELDGEPRGTLPARYEVLPGALRVLAAPA